MFCGFVVPGCSHDHLGWHGLGGGGFGAVFDCGLSTPPVRTVRTARSARAERESGADRPVIPERTGLGGPILGRRDRRQGPPEASNEPRQSSQIWPRQRRTRQRKPPRTARRQGKSRRKRRRKPPPPRRPVQKSRWRR